MERQVNLNPHQVSVHEVLLLLETDGARGLTHDEATAAASAVGTECTALQFVGMVHC